MKNTPTHYRILHSDHPDLLSSLVQSALLEGFTLWGPLTVHGTLLLQPVIKRTPPEPTQKPESPNPEPSRIPSISLHDIIPQHWDGSPIDKEALAQLIRSKLSKHQILARKTVKLWIQTSILSHSATSNLVKPNKTPATITDATHKLFDGINYAAPTT